DPAAPRAPPVHRPARQRPGSTPGRWPRHERRPRMNPLSRVAPVTGAEAAQMVHAGTRADLAERLTSTPVEAAAAEEAAGNAARQSPRRSRGWPAAGLVRRTAGPRRWPGWLTPVAAAVAVTGVII